VFSPPGKTQEEKTLKRIINGKIYNTETADCIATWHNGHHGGDFNRCEESLYRTKKGAWFIAGEGGPLSKYARPVGNMTSGGDGLEPITAKEAQQWLEEKDYTEQLEAYFAEGLQEA
jgi:hypothetical protein